MGVHSEITILYPELLPRQVEPARLAERFTVPATSPRCHWPYAVWMAVGLDVFALRRSRPRRRSLAARRRGLKRPD